MPSRSVKKESDAILTLKLIWGASPRPMCFILAFVLVLVALVYFNWVPVVPAYSVTAVIVKVLVIVVLTFLVARNAERLLYGNGLKKMEVELECAKRGIIHMKDEYTREHMARRYADACVDKMNEPERWEEAFSRVFY